MSGGGGVVGWGWRVAGQLVGEVLFHAGKKMMLASERRVGVRNGGRKGRKRHHAVCRACAIEYGLPHFHFGVAWPDPIRMRFSI